MSASLEQMKDQLFSAIVLNDVPRTQEALQHFPALREDPDILNLLKGAPYASIVRCFFATKEEALAHDIDNIVEDDSDSDFSSTSSSDFSDTDSDGTEIDDSEDEDTEAALEELIQALRNHPDPVKSTAWRPFEARLRASYRHFLYTTAAASSAGFEEVTRALLHAWKPDDVSAVATWWFAVREHHGFDCLMFVSDTPRRFAQWMAWLDADIVSRTREIITGIAPGSGALYQRFPFVEQALQTQNTKTEDQFVAWWKNTGLKQFLTSLNTENVAGSSLETSPLTGRNPHGLFAGSSTATPVDTNRALSSLIEKWLQRTAVPRYSFIEYVTRYQNDYPHPKTLARAAWNLGLVDIAGNLIRDAQTGQVNGVEIHERLFGKRLITDISQSSTEDEPPADDRAKKPRRQ